MIKRLTTNAGWLFVAQIFNYLAPLLVLPYLTRTLPQAEFGAVMVAFSAVQLAFVITDYGFSLSATQTIAQSDRSPQAVTPLIGAIFTAKILLCIVGVLGLIALSYLPAYSEHQGIFFASIGAVVFQAFQPVWLFQGLEKMKAYATASALVKIAYVVLVFPLVSESGDGWRVMAAWSIANLIGLLVNAKQIHTLGYRMAFSGIQSAIFQLRAAAHYFWSRIAVATYTASSSILVSMAGMQEAALFAAPERIYNAAKNGTAPISQALYPYMAANRDWHMFFKLTALVSVFVATGCVVLSYFSTELLTLLFGETYSAAREPLLYLSATIFVNFIGVNFGYPACAAVRKPSIANNSVLIGSSFFVICTAYHAMRGEVTAVLVAKLVFATEIIVACIRVSLIGRILLSDTTRRRKNHIL